MGSLDDTSRLMLSYDSIFWFLSKLKVISEHEYKYIYVVYRTDSPTYNAFYNLKKKLNL